MSWLWTDTPFVLFGPAHLVALGLIAAAAILLAWCGRQLRGRPGQKWISRALALTILVCLGGMQTVMLLPEHFEVGKSLPLQICDIAGIIAIYALWTERRWAFGLVYYWGLSATLLAMVTPDLRHGFPHFSFLLFFVGHGAVVVAAIYLCWGVGLRPDWRLFRLAVVVTIAYAIGIFIVNTILDTNFFCINHKPPPGTMLDYFGPYPMHILVCTLIALGAWAALTWPWQLLARRHLAK